MMIQLDNLRQSEQQLQIEETTTTNDNEKMLNNLREKYDKQAKNIMVQYFNVLTQIARECKNSEIQEINRLKRLLFGNSDFDFWAASEKLIPKGLPAKIKKICPDLDPNEIKICCLTYLNADVTAISIALNLKDVTIYSISSRIRNKLELGAKKNIKRFLEEKFEEII